MKLERSGQPNLEAGEKSETLGESSGKAFPIEEEKNAESILKLDEEN